jgi:hypothetical protein
MAETTRIDALIERAKHSIELMKERRSALISAAVTDKLMSKDSFDMQNAVPIRPPAPKFGRRGRIETMVRVRDVETPGVSDRRNIAFG